MPISNRERMRMRRAHWNEEQLAESRKKSRERMRRLRAKRKLSPTQKRRQQSNERLLRKSGINSLTDAEAVIAYLDHTYTNDETKRSYLGSIVGEYRDDPTFPAEALAKYRKKMLFLIERLRSRYADNLKSDRDKKGWVEWPDLVKAREKCDAEGPLLDRVIFSLYMDTAPRRAEYRFLKILKGIPHEEISGAENVVGLNEDGSIAYVSLGEYKTKASYGRQTIPGERFGPALAEYCATVGSGYLFKVTHRGSSWFSQLVSRTFKRYTGKRASINILRKSYVTHLAKTRPAMSTNEQAKVARDMGTSLFMMQTAYRKVD